MPRRRPLCVFPLSTLTLLCCLLIAACGSQEIRLPGLAQQAQSTAAPSPNTQSISDRAIPPVILHNPAPHELEVVFDVNMTSSGADSGNMIIGLSFLSHGNPVQLLGDVQVRCNGKAMPVHQHYALFQLANAAPQTLQGTALDCTYHVSNSTTSFSLSVPQAPVIRSPREGASVSRSPHTAVSYQYDSQSGRLLGLVALGAGTKTIAAHLDISDQGQATLDTSTFPPGKGSIALTQALTPRVAWTGTPFRSLQAEGMATAQISITWI